MGYEFITESRVSVVVYDVEIEDIDERRKNAIEFSTLKLACQRLGINWKPLKKSIEDRGRIYSPFLDKTIAVRYSKPNNY